MKALTCAMFPDPWRDEWHRYHPFLAHLARELDAHGCRVIQSPDRPTLVWMHQVREEVDVIHIHWPELFYQTGSKYRIGVGFVRLWQFLIQVRIYRLPLVWTIHEIYPHSTHYLRYPIWAHRYARRLLCRCADVITANCGTARDWVEEEFAPPRKIEVVELGNYAEFYPDNIEREDARRCLGLSEKNIVFLVFGTMRPNRNPAEVVRAFRRLADSRACLFVIGQAPGILRDEVEKAAWGDWRIRVFPYVLDNELVCTYFKACDVVVMSGHDYTTSAVIMLGLSYGKPIICARSGCAPEMAGEAGIYFDPDQPDGLILALQQAMASDLTVLGSAAQIRSREFSWRKAAGRFRELYQRALDSKSTGIPSSMCGF